MKGMEWETALSIIILIVLLILVASYFLVPLANVGTDAEREKNFRHFCILWSRQHGYEGDVVERKNYQDEDMDPHCTWALRIDCATPDIGCMPDDPYAEEWERCRFSNP